MENSFKKWWNDGTIGTFDTNITIEDKTLMKLAVAVILVFVIIFVSAKLINQTSK